MNAALVPGGQVAEVLTLAHQILAARGIARDRHVHELPGRPFGECPVSLNAAVNIAAGHGPYPGCLAPACERCARAGAARWALLHRLPALPVTIGEVERDHGEDAAAVMLATWVYCFHPADEEILTLVTETAAAHRPSTELELCHIPVGIWKAGAYLEEPECADVCSVCWELWPCLVAHLCGFPDARPAPIVTAAAGPFCEEPPF